MRFAGEILGAVGGHEPESSRERHAQPAERVHLHGESHQTSGQRRSSGPSRSSGGRRGPGDRCRAVAAILACVSAHGEHAAQRGGERAQGRVQCERESQREGAQQEEVVRREGEVAVEQIVERETGGGGGIGVGVGILGGTEEMTRVLETRREHSCAEEQRNAHREKEVYAASGAGETSSPSRCFFVALHDNMASLCFAVCFLL
mmetsp:Transcript_10062/g.25150  ORF Transcript_10062/g.25150 Transcript_10062/m.25150 type:complete len:204 (-) Transcript_10062:37-648(-)